MEPAAEANLVVEPARLQERECSDQVVVQRSLAVAERRRTVLPEKDTELLEIVAPPLPRLENQRLAQLHAFSRHAPAGVQESGGEDDGAVSLRQDRPDDIAALVEEHRLARPVWIPFPVHEQDGRVLVGPARVGVEVAVGAVGVAIEVAAQEDAVLEVRTLDEVPCRVDRGELLDSVQQVGDVCQIEVAGGHESPAPMAVRVGAGVGARAVRHRFIGDEPHELLVDVRRQEVVEHRDLVMHESRLFRSRQASHVAARRVTPKPPGFA